MNNISTSSPIQILLVEDNAGDAELIRKALQNSGQIGFEVTWAEQLQEAVEWTHATHFDLVLLDLSLPDSHGRSTLLSAREQFSDLPIVVLTGNSDERLGMEAVQEGAEDFLIKGQVGGGQLTRALCYALTRHTARENIRATAMVDELTGLSNRRGLLTLAGQQMKLAQRSGSPFLLIYIDLDRFKAINDTFGHRVGDCALQDTAAILRNTFRASDVIARLGGDEFVVAVLEADAACAETLTARMQESLDTHNAQANRPYVLKMSVGVVQYNPAHDCSIETLLAEADAAMYARKRQRDTAGVNEVQPLLLT